jgi:hypothetical protein
MATTGYYVTKSRVQTHFAVLVFSVQTWTNCSWYSTLCPSVHLPQQTQEAQNISSSHDGVDFYSDWSSWLRLFNILFSHFRQTPQRYVTFSRDFHQSSHCSILQSVVLYAKRCKRNRTTSGTMQPYHVCRCSSIAPDLSQKQGLSFSRRL